MEHVFVKLFIDNAISVTQRSIEVHCYAWQVYRKSHREGHDANGTIDKCVIGKNVNEKCLRYCVVTSRKKNITRGLIYIYI